ncbi:hypothetical protein ZWY2020_052030 [Hordeum vulgare]|nr:hypothetical protein ZWY2020_052030 [Hordeum vulgare]
MTLSHPDASQDAAPSSSSWTLSRSATPFTTATAFRWKLHRARAIAGGGAQSLADAVRWEAKQVYGGKAAGAGGGKDRLWLKLPVDRSKFVPVALKVDTSAQSRKF